MGKSLRENFEHLLAELPAFRQDLGKVVEAAVKEEPGLKESLGELLKGFDASMAEAKAEMPSSIAGLEKEMDSFEPGIDELRKSIAEAEQAMVATPPIAAATTAAFVPLPNGHGQTLRTELLRRFAPAQTATPVKPAAGDVHDLASGEFKDVSAGESPPKRARPATGIQPPSTKPKPPGDDVGDMQSQDWR